MKSCGVPPPLWKHSSTECNTVCNCALIDSFIFDFVHAGVMAAPISQTLSVDRFIGKYISTFVEICVTTCSNRTVDGLFDGARADGYQKPNATIRSAAPSYIVHCWQAINHQASSVSATAFLGVELTPSLDLMETTNVQLLSETCMIDSWGYVLYEESSLWAICKIHAV